VLAGMYHQRVRYPDQENGSGGEGGGSADTTAARSGKTAPKSADGGNRADGATEGDRPARSGDGA
jgi:hypothetical protein